MVWRTARRLHAALAGRPLTVSDFRWPSLATVDLTGRQVLEVVSAGKHLLTRVESDGASAPVTVHSHLRMDGSWHFHRTVPAATAAHPGTGRKPTRPGGHDVRAVLANGTWTAVGHQLGMLDVVPTDRESTLVGHLGPDVLGPGWDAAEAIRRLAAQPERAVGEALLDQRVLAGVGTFYLAESCFLRGVTPWTPARDAGDLAALVDLVHRLLVANRDRAEQATTGDTRPGHRQWVHARSGRPCRRCDDTVRAAAIGRAPSDRVAFYCPSCQHGPTPTDDGRPQRPIGANRRRSKREPS